MLKKILFITAFYLALVACNKQDKQNEYSEYDYDEIELVIVSKVLRGTYAGEEKPKGSYLDGWCDIGLSQNGEDPIEYIWRARQGPYDYAILNAEMGDSGTIQLTGWAKQNGIKLPKPNAKKPSIIGMFGEVYWERRK
jgi:hypothetical protein